MSNIQSNYERLFYVDGASELRIVRRGHPAPAGGIELLALKPSQTVEVEERILDGDTTPTRVFVATRHVPSNGITIRTLLGPVDADHVRRQHPGYGGSPSFLGKE